MNEVKMKAILLVIRVGWGPLVLRAARNLGRINDLDVVQFTAIVEDLVHFFDRGFDATLDRIHDVLDSEAGTNTATQPQPSAGAIQSNVLKLVLKRSHIVAEVHDAIVICEFGYRFASNDCNRFTTPTNTTIS